MSIKWMDIKELKAFQADRRNLERAKSHEIDIKDDTTSDVGDKETTHS